MNNYLLLGFGLMGKVIAQDLTKCGAVTVADFDPTKRREAQKLGFEFEQIDVNNHDNLVRLMSGYCVAISAVERPEFHYLGLKAAIDARCNFTDLGADPVTLKKQFALHQQARNSDIVAIPDTGACPGITNVLIGYGDTQLDKTDYIHYFAGALPSRPTNPPLNYTHVFSIAVLINEYFEKTEIIQDGKTKQVESLSGLEKINFPGFGEMEAAFVAGATSSLTQTFKNRVKELYEKSIRYPGHYEEIKRIAKSFNTRKDFENYLVTTLPKNEKDVFLLKVIIGGKKDNRDTEITYTLAHKYNTQTNTTATAEATGWPVSIIAQMIANDKIKGKGVLEQEIYVPYQEFLDELHKRGIKIEESIKSTN